MHRKVMACQKSIDKQIAMVNRKLVLSQKVHMQLKVHTFLEVLSQPKPISFSKSIASLNWHPLAIHGQLKFMHFHKIKNTMQYTTNQMQTTRI